MTEEEPSLEVLQVCESTSQSWPVNFYNPVTGAALWSYKGAELQNEPPLDAVIVSNEHLLIPVARKPLAVSLSLSQKNRIIKKSILPAPLDCLAVTSCGLICCAAVKENLYTWTLNDGKLWSIVGGHYQTITKIVFTTDDCYVATSSKDGHILVWNVGDLLTPQDTTYSSKASPVHKWFAHSLTVSDLKVGFGGIAGRLYSVGLDQTAKIHCLASGSVLMTLYFDCSLTSCAVDNAEARFFVGTSKGDIRRIDLYVEPVLRERHVDLASENDESLFKGHKQSVNFLSVNMDGTLLASTGEDCDVRIWHINSRQCVRSIRCKGVPTKALFVLLYPGLHVPDAFCPRTRVAQLSKTVSTNPDSHVIAPLRTKSDRCSDSDLLARRLQDLVEQEYTSNINLLPPSSSSNPELDEELKRVKEELARSEEKLTEMKNELATAKLANKKLYDFCMEKILSK